MARSQGRALRQLPADRRDRRPALARFERRPERVDAAVHQTRICGGATWAFATTNRVCDVFSTWLEDGDGHELPEHALRLARWRAADLRQHVDRGGPDVRLGVRAVGVQSRRSLTSADQQSSPNTSLNDRSVPKPMSKYHTGRAPLER